MILQVRQQLSSSSETTTQSQYESSPQEYGTKTIIKASPLAIDPSHPLSPYIRHCIKSPYPRETTASSSQNQKTMDQTFTTIFLGTGAGGRPNNKRAPSSTALRLSGHTFLFDAGEGTQRQLAFSNLGVLEVGRIFVTHLHADHVGGLLGVILQREIAVKSSLEENGGGGGGQKGEKRTLEIYGPVGLYNLIAMNVALTCSKIRNLKVVVYELVGGSEKRRGVGNRSYPELKSTNIERQTLEKGEDGTWAIQKPAAVGENDVQGRDSHLRVSIKAAEVLHSPGIQTFGYVVEESKPALKIDVDKAKYLGVAPSPKYRALKNGFAVMNDDGSREVRPDEILMDGSAKKARKFALLGDAWKVPTPMRNLCEGADLLVYEATLIDAGSPSVCRERGHSTPEMAGALALETNAKILVMNHISGRNDSQESVDMMVAAAEQGNKGASLITTAYDFMMINIPNE